MAFTKLDIEVKGPQDKTYLDDSYTLNSIEWFNTSSCSLKNSTVQKLSLNVQNNHLDFYFTLNQANNTYNMSSVTFKADNQALFNDTPLLGKKAEYLPDLKIKPLNKSLDQSFECKFRYHMRFNFTKPGLYDVEVDLKILSLKFSAFRESNSIEFQTKNVIHCPDSWPTPRTTRRAMTWCR